MRTLPLLTVALIAGLSLPAAAQNIFKPLQDMVEQLNPQPERRAAPAAPKPDTPPTPRARPEADELEQVPPPAQTDEPDLPRPRPDHDEAEPADEAIEAPAPEAAPEPEPEATPSADHIEAGSVSDKGGAPDAARVYQTACPAVLNGLVEAEALPPISEGVCQEQSPISVTAISSRGRMVPMSTPLTTNCEMASALPGWVEAVDSYALATQKAGLEALVIGSSYVCRNRNNADTGFTSEHGFADAADISGFALSDGRTIAVEKNWLPASSSEGKFLRFAHDAACTGFTTVLGPEANALHHDHFHLDLGCHGKSCTARLCQ